MRPSKLIKIALCFTLAVAAVVGFVLLAFPVTLFTSALSCSAAQKTLTERTLSNNDSIKVRYEPDCSMGGGPRVFLYTKRSDDTDYKQVTRWRGETTDQFEVHTDSPTPIMLTSDRQLLVLRSAKLGWRSKTLTAVINGALPSQYPLLQDGSATLDSFNSESGELTAKVTWGGNYQQLTLRSLPDTKFEFIALDTPEQQPWQQLDLIRGSLVDAKIERRSQEDSNPRLAIELNLSDAGPDRLGVLPLECDPLMVGGCASTKVLMSYPGMFQHPKDLKMPLKVAVGWLVAARQYETSLYIRVQDQFEPVSFESLKNKLFALKPVAWSIKPLDQGIRSENNSEFLRLLVHPVETGPPFYHEPEYGVVVPQDVISKLCQSYVVTVELDFTAVPSEPVISGVKFKAGNIMCKSQTLPML